MQKTPPLHVTLPYVTEKESSKFYFTEPCETWRALLQSKNRRITPRIAAYPRQRSIHFLQEDILQYEEDRKHIHQRMNLLRLTCAKIDYNIRDHANSDTL